MNGAHLFNIRAAGYPVGSADAAVDALGEMVVSPAFLAPGPFLHHHGQSIVMDLETNLILGDARQLKHDLVRFGRRSGFRARREKLRHPFPELTHRVEKLRLPPVPTFSLLVRRALCCGARNRAMAGAQAPTTIRYW